MMLNTVSSHISPGSKAVQELPGSDESKSPRLTILRQFALTSSTDGLPSIARSQSKHNCIFWSVSFFIFTCVMAWFVTQTIRDYFQYPTQISVSIAVERLQTFPAVSFCNYVSARYDLVIPPFLNVTNLFNMTNITDKHIFTPEETLLLYQFFADRINSNQSGDDYFFSLDVMLISCSYNGRTCTADDFISFKSATYGRCFTFNAKKKQANGSELHHTNDDGGSGVLELRLYAQSQLYLQFYAEGLFQ
jgi:hypothetical protein